MNQTLDLAIQNKTSIDALQLVTWNDFGEGTMYEPTYEYGFKMLTNLQAKLGVSYSEYELQQIYRLFDLRKKHSNDQSIKNILNQSRDYFITYQVSNAIALMDNIEGLNNQKLYYIKNRFNDNYLYQDGSVVKYSSETSNDNFKWKLIIAGNGYYYLENAFSGDKIHMENQTGSLECTPIALDSPSSIWEKRTVNGTHNRFINNSSSNQYINIENDLGYAEHSSINASRESFQWELKEAPNILDLNKATFRNVLIFPNPTNDFLHINTGNFGMMNGYSLKIENNMGQVVFSNLINQQQFIIDLTTWSGNGVYFLKIFDPQNNQISLKKIVLQ